MHRFDEPFLLLVALQDEADAVLFGDLCRCFGLLLFHNRFFMALVVVVMI
jgi:hypothetical protein